MYWMWLMSYYMWWSIWNGDDGKAHVIVENENVPEEVIHLAEEARDSCPVAAIEVE